MFCTKCGAKLKEESKFCEKCGAPVKEIKAVKNDAGRKSLVPLFVGVAVLLLVAVLGVGRFFFKGKEASEPADTENGEDKYPVHIDADVRTDEDDTLLTLDRETYSSLGDENRLAESESVLALEEDQKLQRLLNNMAQAAWWSNGELWIGNNGTTYLDMANGMQIWADNLYQGNWKELGDLVSAISFWQDVPYVTQPLDLPEGGKDPTDDSEYGVSLTKEQMEYLAYAATGTEWKIQNIDEILGSMAAYGSEIKYNNDIIRIIDTSYDSYIWLELENVATEYIGEEKWSITADGIYFDQHAPELSNIKFVDITFTVTRNPNSCFDGYSVIGMSVTPTEGAKITFNGVVEDEVARIREVYSDIVSGISSEIYEERNLAEGITGYYDAGNLRAVIIANETNGIKYARWYYYENGKLFFAYYEGRDAHRFYFYEDELIRWRYSADALDAQAAVNHDMEETDEYREWEAAVLQESFLYY